MRTKKSSKKGKKKSASAKVWMPGVPGAEPDEEGLDYDPTAYTCLTTLSLGWPCLSFDMLPDALGDQRTAFPHTLSFVAGWVGRPAARLNSLSVCCVTNLTALRHGKDPLDDSDSDSSSSEDEDADGRPAPGPGSSASAPVLHIRRVAHAGAVNRVRAMPQSPALVAAWSEAGSVGVWDLGAPLEEARAEPSPDASRSERLARIAPRSPAPAGKWAVGAAYRGHQGPVEDLQWSPTEDTVFASAGADQTLRIWDTREKTKPMLTVAAHEAEVNVAAWSASTAYMLASGGDDGLLRVWDLRAFASGQYVASLKYHSAPITSLEWSPHESSMLLSTGEDGQTAVWDLALERDPEEEAALAPETNAAVPDELPPQLLFVHAGQRDVKEGHWHAQIPGLMVTTAADGFNLFKPANV
ncbi:Glutamate-rich WD repeat-containing protein 1 [Auxenochlorella protothecoides]|uniref:Glutamate-rich WD repeat-containing protein 1 n=1 Tax=Auxenochlorella protothecoides TaxID=3075 RepID=A0A087SKB5_AUXPR|nr:Glutamate-rich WD repeat-containing protein 1 [Auxenochlorella protothecoides]KFM26169.1 Glutamate-rich WD repeat-containing protein 1 [Auxenochlorella protothecoides]